MFSISSSETALTWLAIDFSEDEVNGITEKLAVRFKLAETKDEFKKIFEECQEKLKNKPPQSALNATAKVSDNFFHKYLHVSLIQLKTNANQSESTFFLSFHYISQNHAQNSTR